jgi:SulP family sulfate permease
MVAVYGLIDTKEPKHLFSIKPIDGWTLLLTFAATLVLGIDTGILVGAAFSLMVFIWRSAYPHTAELGYLETEKVFRNIRRYPDAKTYPKAAIVRVDASLYFANMAFLETYLANLLAERPNLNCLILDFSAVNDMDAVALETLEKRMDELAKIGIETHLVSIKGPVRDLLERARWFEKYGDKIRHLSLEHALRSCNPGGV